MESFERGTDTKPASSGDFVAQCVSDCWGPKGTDGTSKGSGVNPAGPAGDVSHGKPGDTAVHSTEHMTGATTTPDCAPATPNSSEKGAGTDSSGKSNSASKEQSNSASDTGTLTAAMGAASADLATIGAAMGAAMGAASETGKSIGKETGGASSTKDGAKSSGGEDAYHGKKGSGSHEPAQPASVSPKG